MLLICSSRMPKENPRNGLQRPSTDSTFEVIANGKVHRVTGNALQRWILNERKERRGPAGYVFGKRPLLDESRGKGQRA